MSYFQLDGSDIKNPTTFKVSRYRITKSNRLADGTMSMEFIAKKRKFFFTYDGIEDSDMQTILDALWETDEVFYDLDYMENGEWKKATVYAGEIPTELKKVQDKNGKWVWSGFNFNLIEK
jgi:hypothetical protein